ncbi:MAG: hypothetical protein KBG48_32250 [Kofleriaceae bacterium]|nr:hypothetical protein [Kofleriaceae bacterium]MBP9172107.1 hypothetical protein [Kofleriaceae bacterium]MBP9859576.1 hypothetical protein [Kofleriaceae bacterium]
MDVAPFTGDRGALQALFELADDSPTQLAAYRDAGRCWSRATATCSSDTCSSLRPTSPT